MPWKAGKHETWGIFKRHFWGVYTRHSQVNGVRLETKEEVEAYVVHHAPYDLEEAGYVTGTPGPQAVLGASPVTRQGAERMRGLL
jgi:hypothetical protein